MKVFNFLTLLFVVASAENALIDTLVAGLTTYLGLASQRQEKDEFKHVKDHVPKVKNFGFNASKFTSHANPWGADLGINFDIGLAYELPLYNVDNYLVSRQRFHAYVGGRNYVSLYLSYFRLHFYFDLWPVRCTFLDNYIQFDIVEYDDWCTTSHWYLDTFRM